MKTKKNKKQQFPSGWDEKRVQEVIAYYDSLTEEEWLAEDEAAWSDKCQTTMQVPTELVTAIAALIARSRSENSTGGEASQRIPHGQATQPASTVVRTAMADAAICEAQQIGVQCVEKK